MTRIAAGGALCALALALSACAFQGEYDPATYLDYFPDDETNGTNYAPFASLWATSALENGQSYDTPVGQDDEMVVFANWYGFRLAALNDRVVAAITPDMDNVTTPSVGWSSATKEMPQAVVLDFGSPVSIGKVILYARTDTMAGYGDPGGKFPQAYKVYITNQNPVKADGSLNTAVLLDAALDYASTAVIRPSLSKPGVSHSFTPQSGRYLVLYITQATGDFVQLSEIEAYDY